MLNAYLKFLHASQNLIGRLKRQKTHSVIRFREQLWKNDCNAIIIHQMGKVGSSSVYETLRKHLPRRRLYHTHFLNPNRIAAFVANDPVNEGLYHIACSQFLIDHLDQYERLQIVSLVREPIARNVSAFFQNRYKFFADQDMERWQENLGALKERFLAEYPHEIPAMWLDNEIWGVFDIDVFSQPFPTQIGGKVFRAGRVELLILRQDALNRAGAQFLSEFVEHDIPMLESSNIGERKDYSMLYNSFLSELRFPTPFVEHMYGSRYAQHFFTPEEISAFRKRWNQ